MSTLFLGWQDPISRRWFPIGRLESGPNYLFSYTKGAEQAHSEAGFEPLTSFPEMHTAYMAESLFPLFSNRLLPPSRPEYREYLRWLNMPETENDPMAILARSGGRRVTDTLEVFPSLEPNENGTYEILFLVHGLNHMPEESIMRALRLVPGERLAAICDFQPPDEPEAIALRTKEFEVVGYCPLYLRADVLRLIQLDCSPTITVERVNRPPAPSQFRVLCRALMTWPKTFKPFNTHDYDPIVPVNISPVLATGQLASHRPEA